MGIRPPSVAALGDVRARDLDAKQLMPPTSTGASDGVNGGGKHLAPSPPPSDVESPLPEDGALLEEDALYSLDDAIDRCGRFGLFQLGMLGFTGLSWVVDAMEVAILTYLASAAKCEWGLTAVQESVLTSAVFAGMCVGAPVWGAVSDAKGRKFSFGFGVLFTCVFGFASAAAPSYACLMAFRALVGFGIPSTCVAFNWLGECVPTSTRGFFLVGIEAFWTIGTVAQAVLAYALLNKFGWRIMLAVSAIPSALLVLFVPFVPESPRWLAVQGRTAEAEATLARMLRFSRKAPMPGHLRPLHVPAQRPPPAGGPVAALVWRAKNLAASVAGGLRGLFSKMASTHVYYGLVYLVGQISFMSGGAKVCEPSLGGQLQIPRADLEANLITASAEIPGLCLSLVLVHLCSRRVAYAAPMVAVAILMVPLMAGVAGSAAIAPLFLSRLFVYAAYAFVFTTAEVYPTSIRGFALGFCNSMSRIGGLLSSFTVAARETAWAHTPEAVFFALSLASAVALLLLPQPDAKGAHLADTVEDIEERQLLEASEAAAAGRTNSVISRAFPSALGNGIGSSGGGAARPAAGGSLVARRKPSNAAGGGGSGGGAGGAPAA